MAENNNPNQNPAAEGPSQSAPAGASTPVSESAPKESVAPQDAPKQEPPASEPKAQPKPAEQPKPKKEPKRIPNEVYVKRQKQKKIALIVFGITAVGCIALGIIAFLGDTSGNFTVQMDDTKAVLTMATNNDFDKKTSYLRATGMKKAYAYSADWLPDDAVIDDNNGGTKNGFVTYAEDSSDTGTDSVSVSTASSTQEGYAYDSYFGYTFFVRNVGAAPASFSLEYNIDNYKNPTNVAISLLDIVRVRVYENLITVAEDGTSSTTHESQTFARVSNKPFVNDSGQIENREPIGKFDADVYEASNKTKVIPAANREENNAYATPFISNTVVYRKTYENLPSNQSLRYTVVMWIEGWDQDCYGAEPKNASMTFSMHYSVI